MGFGGLYTSMSGLETAMQRLDTTAENLANVDTQGYASAQTDALSLPYIGARPLPGADVMSLGEKADTQQGPLQRTGGAFDVAVEGGWLVVQGPGGKPTLTRSGQLALSGDGVLVTANGDPLLNSNGSPVSLPALKDLTISESGRISGVPDTSASNTPQVFAQLLIAQTPTTGVTPIGNSLYALPTGATPTPAVKASVRQGYLEGSNVDPVRSMMDLIDVTRGFQLQTQLVAQATKDSSQLDQVLLA